MRLLNLDLIAYGPFTDTTLDLSGGEEGLHILYGPNEAGKSAALRALHALLYGIAARTADNFLHENSKLRIGATVRHSDGSELAIVRRKGNNNTLLATDGLPLDDALLRNYLSGVTSEVFSTMFGIDHERLLRGGESLVAGDGEIASSLYAAALGISNLRDVLKQLENESDAIFKKGGSRPKINALLSRHKDLRSSIASLMLPARDWQAVTDQISSTSEKCAAVANKAKELRTALARMERLKEAIPAVAERKKLQNDLTAMGEVTFLPPESHETRLEAQRLIAAATTTKDRACQDMDTIKSKINLLQIPAGLLDERDRIDESRERLGSHRKAQRDKPGIVAKREALLNEVQNILSELTGDTSLDQVPTYRLPVSKTAKIERLGRQYEKLRSELDRAGKEAKDSAKKLTDAKDDLQQSTTPLDSSELKAAARRARRLGDLDEQLETARNDARTARLQAEADLKALTLWKGSLDDLLSFPAPMSETIDRYENSIAEAEAAKERLTERLSENAKQSNDLQRKILELQAVGEVPTNSQLDEARSHRDVLWRLVLRAWQNGEGVTAELLAIEPDRELPAAFEHSVEQADHVVDRLRAEADRVVALEQLLARRVECEKTDDRLNTELARTESEISRIHDEWQKIWSDFGSEPLPPKEMRSWLRQREKIIAQADTIRKAGEDAEKLAAQILAERQKLWNCLNRLNESSEVEGESLAGLLDRCDDAVTRLESTARAYDKLAEKVNDLEQRHLKAAEDMEAANASFEKWRADWGECVSVLQLPSDADPAEAAAVLERVKKTITKYDEAQELVGRIEGIDRDAELFAKDVAEIAGRVAADLLALPTEQIVAELSRRLAEAVGSSATLEQLLIQKDEKSEILRKADLDITEATITLASLCSTAKCEKPEDLETIEERSATARQLQEKIQQAEQQIARCSGGAGLEKFILEAEQTDADSLPGLIAELKRQIDDQDQHIRNLSQTIGAENQKLQAMDGSAKAAEAAEAAQACLAEIRAAADRYAHLKIAAAVLERAIERYSEANQAPILTRASELFARLTCGAFTGLRTDLCENDKPMIEGVRQTCEKVPVHCMSDGTRDQLYLALRLASLERHFQNAEPMPFIIDDVLINFDDQRSEATLAVLADLSEKTQIIFFTHHIHLVELAKRVVPEKVLHVQHLQS